MCLLTAAAGVSPEGFLAGPSCCAPGVGLLEFHSDVALAALQPLQARAPSYTGGHADRQQSSGASESR